MGRKLIPVVIMQAMLAFATAALLVGDSPARPTWWRAGLTLAVLGAITPMIYAVNIRIVPVFSRRRWRDPHLLSLMLILMIIGAWLSSAAWAAGWRNLLFVGSALALASGVLFLVNLARLFSQPIGVAPAMPLPFPEQARIDQIAIQFTRLSALYLIVGLIVGMVTSINTPERGRWELLWVHTMLAGFVLSMAAGVSYHVMSRWTGKPWLATWPITLHFVMMTVSLPLMLIALATDATALFKIAGPMLAIALVIFVVMLAPMALGLPGLSREALMLAAAFLLAGVALGAAFAADPATGARLRPVHAELNLFGWTGLLICGVGYYLVPRFAGAPLRWPGLAPLQLILLAAGVTVGAVAFYAQSRGAETRHWIWLGQGMVATAFALFAVLTAATFRNRPGTAVKITLPSRSPAQQVTPFET